MKPTVNHSGGLKNEKCQMLFTALLSFVRSPKKVNTCFCCNQLILTQSKIDNSHHWSNVGKSLRCLQFLLGRCPVLEVYHRNHLDKIHMFVNYVWNVEILIMSDVFFIISYKHFQAYETGTNFFFWRPLNPLYGTSQTTPWKCNERLAEYWP